MAVEAVHRLGHVERQLRGRDRPIGHGVGQADGREVRFTHGTGAIEDSGITRVFETLRDGVEHAGEHSGAGPFGEAGERHDVGEEHHHLGVALDDHARRGLHLDRRGPIEEDGHGVRHVLHQTLRGVLLGEHPRVELLRLAVEQPHLDHVLNAGQHLCQIERLAEEVPRASLERAHFVIGMCRQHEHGNVVVRLDLFEAFHHLKAIHARHVHIEQDEIEVVDQVQLADLARVGGRRHVEIAAPFEELLEQGDVGFFVIDDQDLAVENVCLANHGLHVPDCLTAGWVCNTSSMARMNSTTLMGLVR